MQIAFSSSSLNDIPSAFRIATYGFLLPPPIFMVEMLMVSLVRFVGAFKQLTVAVRRLLFSLDSETMPVESARARTWRLPTDEHWIWKLPVLVAPGASGSTCILATNWPFACTLVVLPPAAPVPALRVVTVPA